MDKRKIENINIRITPEEKNMINKYVKERGIKNKTEFIMNIIKNEINENNERHSLVG